MKNEFKTGLIAAAVAALIAAAAPVAAQDLIGRDSVAGERNDDLVEAIQDDAERDLQQFGNEGRAQGFTGSFALRGAASSGNTDTVDVGIGSDMLYVWAQNGVELRLNYTYGEEEGEKSEESLLYGLEYTRDFNPRVFGFANAQGSVDGFSDFESDTFVSLGAGYRVFTQPDMQWSLQAGPGYRYAELRDVTRNDIDEAAFGIGSDYFARLTDSVFLTNDTDVVWSESDTAVFNDLALNVAVTETLALRTSLLTEYHSDVAPGRKTPTTHTVFRWSTRSTDRATGKIHCLVKPDLGVEKSTPPFCVLTGATAPYRIVSLGTGGGKCGAPNLSHRNTNRWRKNMDTSTLKIGALVGLIAAGSVAMAVSAQSTETDTVIVTEEAAIAAALEVVPGEVQEVELEREDGAQVYEIEILAEDGSETEVEIAAATGDVLEIEREDGKCDKDRDA